MQKYEILYQPINNIKLTGECLILDDSDEDNNI